MNFLRNLIKNYYIFQFIASKIYSLFFFLKNKKKIKIYYEDNCWIHETFLGKFATVHPIRNAEQYLIKELFFFLKYYNCNKGDIIFDAGAGIGTEVIFFSRLVGNSGKVYALEANPIIYDLLLKTIKINNLKNVIPINFAAFDTSGKVVSFSSDAQNWLGGKINFNEGNIKVSTKTFDDIIIEFKIPKIDFAKFNIEGAEKYLIYGEQLLIKLCKNICVSCHDFLNDNDSNTFENIRKMLAKNNFRLLNGNENIYNISQDKLFYVYATRSSDTVKERNINEMRDYETFYKKLF